MSGDEACFESIMSKGSMSGRNAEILESRGEGMATCGGSDNLGMFENAPRLHVGDGKWHARASHVNRGGGHGRRRCACNKAMPWSCGMRLSRIHLTS
jgi:hypothetical protein